MTALLQSVADVRSELQGARRVGFVPTMGALHDGHLSLVRRARADSDVVVVSIFVNPLQFAPTEDLDSYPRDLSRDLALLRGDADVVFAPDAPTFTPPQRRTTVHVDGLTDVLEGASRPGHFDGVTTIVTKLLNVVAPERVYFGEKDYQQLAVIRALVADLDLPVAVVGCPTVRDPDGLALSSRNAYLSASQRADALALPQALFAAADEWDGDPDETRRALRARLEHAPGIRLDYAEVVDPVTLVPLHGAAESGAVEAREGPARALVAAFVGPTRLIDNLQVGPGQPG